MLSTITARLTEKNDDYIASITGGMGVIDKNTGELRSTMDILKDLSKAWEGLTSVEKQELTETVAGKTQRALFTALMQNFSTAVDATTDALNSEGSAATENAKRMDSLQGKIQQLESAWQSFARNTIDSDFVKNILSGVTGLIKFADAAGGLVPILTTLGSALAIFKAGSLAKGISDLVNKFSDFKKTVSDLGGGFKAFQLALSGAKTAEDAAKISTLGLATAAQTLMTALGVIGVVVGTITTAYNLYTNAQKEANEAAVKNSEDAGKIVKSKEEEKQKIQEEVKKLEEEKEAYESNAKARGNTSDNTDFLKSKNEEIAKRQENIDKIDEEIEKEKRKREAAAKSYKPQDVQGAGISSTELGLEGLFDSRFQGAIANINKEIEGLSKNTGEYNNKLVAIRDEYQKQADKISGLNGNTKLYDKIIRALNAEIQRNTKVSNENEKIASDLYDMQKSGIDISKLTLANGENALEYMQKYYGYTNEQIKQLQQGIDIKTTDAEATKSQAEATENLTEKQKEYKEELDNAQKAQNDENEKIDEAQKSFKTLSTAVDEYNSSGYLSIDTLQSLLALSDDQIASLSLQNGQLSLNTQSIDEMTDALVAQRVNQLQAAASEDLYNLAIGNTKSMSTLAKTAISNLDSQTSGIGKTFSSQVKGITEFTNALLAAKSAAGDSSTENFEAKANAIIQSYQNVYKSITSLGEGTTKAGGTGGSNHKYTGKSSGSKKSGSSSKSSSKEEYKATIDTLYNYKNALENAKESVDKLKDAIKDTDNFNEQEKYIRQVIDALNDEINKTNDLKNAQTNQINDYIDQLRAQGFAIDYSADKNELYINNMQHLADFSGDTAKNLEKLIKKIQDLNDDNRDLDGTIRNLRSDVKDYYEQLEEIPEKKLKKFNELLKEFQQRSS